MWLTKTMGGICLRQSKIGTNKIVHKLSDMTRQPNNPVVPILSTRSIEQSVMWKGKAYLSKKAGFVIDG